MSPIKAGCFVICLSALTAQAHAQVTTVSSLTIAQVNSVVERHFAKQNHRAGDIIAQSDVKQILAALKALDWQVSDGKELLEQTLSDSNYLVQQLNTRPGQRFMKKVSHHPMIYSRLDRLIREPGGRALVRDLIRLPNGEKYAQPSPPRGVPEMSEFLPKRGNSRQRRVKDYKKPTGRIYTVGDLLKRLQQSYKKDILKTKKV